MLTVALAHAHFDEGRRAMLPGVVDSWEGGVTGVVRDYDRDGAWSTVRRGWHTALAESGGYGHLLIAQDDFRLARGGYKLMEGLCDRFPDRVMSFRWPLAIDAWAGTWVADRDECWLQASFAWTGGAVAVPAHLVPTFLAWCEEYERVVRSIKLHPPEFVEHVLRHRDDFRLDLFLISRDITVWRCRWSLLRHLGDDHSLVRGGPRPPSPELHLVETVEDLPAPDDPRWDGADAPSCMAINPEYRNAVAALLGGCAGQLGLGHALW